jgi:hypothetical protein
MVDAVEEIIENESKTPLPHLSINLFVEAFLT